MSNAQNLGVSPTITIGPIRLEGRALLAPMSGISDLAMRRIARRFGASLVFSEMVAAETFLRGETEASVRAEGEGLSPHAVQIVGCEAGALAETARRVVAAGAVLVDINMGCPSRRVSGALAGAALMRDLDNAERLIATVVAAVSVPVTVKMRLGWDETSLNAPELARRAEQRHLTSTRGALLMHSRHLLNTSAQKLAGTVAVQFVINQDGSVQGASVATNQEAGNDTTPLADPNVVQCVVGGFGKLKCPAPQGGYVTVVYPIVFAPGD